MPEPKRWMSGVGGSPRVPAPGVAQETANATSVPRAGVRGTASTQAST